MVAGIFKWFQVIRHRALQLAASSIRRWIKPLACRSALNLLPDVAHRRLQVIAENLGLRQQRLVLNCSVKRPHFG